MRFDVVTVFHFPRCQGFVSVPSHGGASLGMVWNHSALHRYTLEEHAAARQRRHRERLMERLSEERLERWRNKVRWFKKKISIFVTLFFSLQTSLLLNYP